MDFKELELKKEYRSITDDIINSFYIPLLGKAKLYRRAVGFFSSSALIEISYGITKLIENGGKIQLIVSPRLQEEDVIAIRKGYEERDTVIEKAIMNSFTEPKDYFETERLNILANLISRGDLDIKVAFISNESNIGIYHEKVGIIDDGKGNTVVFTGSMNETVTAFSHNYETIDVFCSWEEDRERVLIKEAAFNNLWNNSEPRMETVDFPKVALNKLQSYKSENINMQIDIEEFPHKTSNTESFVGPIVPKDINLHAYQVDAINNWESQGFKGIFDMATGTGKTYTGLGAIARLFNVCDRQLAVVIVCPYQHLVEQWVEDIVKFNMKPIVGYSASRQRDWRRKLKENVIAFNLGIQKHFCFITTNATFSSDYISQQMDLLSGNVVLLIDEAHNFGATRLSKTLNPNIPYRLALSATLERHGDEEGTDALYSYFGNKCIEYTLEMAIKEKMLTPYYYHPIVVNLNDDELGEYQDITKELHKYLSKDKKGKTIISETGKLLLIKRARIVAGAYEKLVNLETLMQEYKDEKHILVYCGATTIRDTGYEEGRADESELRQVDAVASILGNKLNMSVSKFTSEETMREREVLKSEFSDGKHLQALIAIRCLDEGVNIPSIKLAFILASSTNPKEYVQRRGRVLRKAKNKSHAVIYDFITLPRPLDQVKNLSSDETRMDISLVKKEVSRLKDFASIAENPSEADKLINNIESAYDLLRIGGTEYEF